jgi:D-serine deaminase-like pyridoxal phosphate-dependent protein
MQRRPARAGDPLDTIETPALVVDLDAYERNLDRMAEGDERPAATPSREIAQVLDDREGAACARCRRHLLPEDR